MSLLNAESCRIETFNPALSALTLPGGTCFDASLNGDSGSAKITRLESVPDAYTSNPSRLACRPGPYNPKKTEKNNPLWSRSKSHLDSGSKMVILRVPRHVARSSRSTTTTTYRPWLSSGRRSFSVKPDDIKPQESQKARSRVQRLTARLPRFLQGYTKPLIDAPLTHISAFLILHEFTAIAPLIGLSLTFHYAKWLPPFFSEGKWVSEGIEKFGRYFKKKGWLDEKGETKGSKWWGRGEGGTRVIIEYVNLTHLSLAH